MKARMTFQRGSVAAFGLAASFVVFTGCHANVTVTRRDDGLYHLKCSTTLQSCLGEAANLCKQFSFVVLRGYDERDYRGRSDVPEGVPASEALIACGPRSGWGNLEQLRAEPLAKACGPATPPPAAPAGPAHLCTPGASQACVGPGACSGGQACRLDGTGFGPCDCGGTPSP
jgi:hypothetical protein